MVVVVANVSDTAQARSNDQERGQGAPPPCDKHCAEPLSICLGRGGGWPDLSPSFLGGKVEGVELLLLLHYCALPQACDGIATTSLPERKLVALAAVKRYCGMHGSGGSTSSSAYPMAAKKHRNLGAPQESLWLVTWVVGMFSPPIVINSRWT